MEWWVWITIAFIIWGIFKLNKDKNKKCAWCDGTKIKFKNGEQGNWYWEYRNKDGSRDKRVKDNFQQASYTSTFICDECGATTQFRHFVDKKPSADVKVSRRRLVTKGDNERKGTDWKDDSAVTVHTDQANRKNN